MRPKKPRHKRRPGRPQIELVCAEIGPEDGVDPRDARRGHRPDRAGRKTLQPCKQVERALSLALAGDCSDPVLGDLNVVSVAPAPNAGRLLVTVSPSLSAAPVDPNEVTAHLARASGKLRCEIAAAIYRKKTPELAFCVVATGPNAIAENRQSIVHNVNESWSLP
jgi:ribosome-binding factor A